MVDELSGAVAELRDAAKRGKHAVLEVRDEAKAHIKGVAADIERMWHRDEPEAAEKVAEAAAEVAKDAELSAPAAPAESAPDATEASA